MSPLTKETMIGLTFGQIIAIISLFITIGVSWTNTQVEIAKIKQDVTSLEKGRIVNASNIEIMRTENRQEHLKMMDKMDLVIYKLNGK